MCKWRRQVYVQCVCIFRNETQKYQPNESFVRCFVSEKKVIKWHNSCCRSNSIFDRSKAHTHAHTTINSNKNNRNLNKWHSTVAKKLDKHARIVWTINPVNDNWRLRCYAFDCFVLPLSYRFWHEVDTEKSILFRTFLFWPKSKYRVNWIQASSACNKSTNFHLSFTYFSLDKCLFNQPQNDVINLFCSI